MPSFASRFSWAVALLLFYATSSLALATTQKPLAETGTEQFSAADISVPLFANLERFSRLVDISYCIGSSGISKPFQCVSRCNEFPSVELVDSWNTGVLLSDSCGYIAVEHGEKLSDHLTVKPAIIVAFRGTYSITNTVIDLSTVPQKYIPYPYPGDDDDELPSGSNPKCENCTVHMGFWQSWKNARKVVLPQLQALKQKYPSYPIQLVGHSLGGAVACLAALELKVSLRWQDVVITTFGEPRVGNYHLARFVDETFNLDGDVDMELQSYRRVTHKEDPVPLLPLQEWGYRSHAGELYISKQDLFPSETDIQLCIGDDDPNCSAGADTNIRETMHRLLHLKGLWGFDENGSNAMNFPTRFKLWQLFFAHRDYFWRLGLCVPGGDPTNWGHHSLYLT